ncbi:MAG: hypothetical protein IAG10_26430 [Planctomycetaceae bacterium]|nr:hypothetical protein [Planctomycetaceae bacterium]
MLRENSSEWCFNPDRRAFLAGLAGTSLLAVGCGAETYENRLKETKTYFEYLEKVNAALGPKDTPFEGIEIRVPKPFVQLLLPAPPAEGKPAEPPPAPSDDPTRLGYHPDVPLEGVIASWKATVRVEAPGSDWGEGVAYVHLLSNLSRWEERQADVDIDPLRYFADLINKLANAYNVQTETADAPWPWIKIGSRDDERHRGFSPYVAKRTVEYIDIPPEDQPINAIFYKTEAKDVQFALLLIYPRNIDPSLHLESRIKHTLEWLKVPSQPPQKKTNKPVTPSLF